MEIVALTLAVLFFVGVLLYYTANSLTKHSNERLRRR